MTNLLEYLCGYLNGFEGRPCDFLPETLEMVLPQASVAMLPGTTRRMYVDGSYYTELPFEIRLRIGGTSMRGKLDAVKFFGELAAYVEKNPMKDTLDGGRMIGIRPNGGCTKSAILQNGNEEYRMQFCVRMVIG